MAIFGNSVIESRLYNKKTSPVYEKYGWLLDINENMLLEAETSVKLDNSVKDFIKEASDYIIIAKASKDKNKDLAKGFALASAGLLLLSAAISTLGPLLFILLSIIGGIIVIIGILFSGLYFAGAAAVALAGYARDVNKLNKLKQEIVMVRSKTTDPKELAQLDEMLSTLDKTPRK